MAKFRLGQIVATTSIIERMKTDHAFNHFIDTSLRRFADCDWGDLAEEDKPMADAAVKGGNGIIMGIYKYSDGTEVWIRTADDHHSTIVHYPHER